MYRGYMEGVYQRTKIVRFVGLRKRLHASCTFFNNKITFLI